MSPRARATKRSTSSSISPSKSKKKSGPLSKKKQPHIEQTLIEPRPKRLSSLTATTLLHYCTNVLSPRRKHKKIPQSSSSPTKKRQISNVSEKPIESHIPIRTRREASSRASAMIMQQNEIERSRYNYSISSIQRHRSKNIVTNKDVILPSESFQFNIPSIPPLPAPARSVTDLSNQTEYVQSSNQLAIKSIHHSTTTITSINSKYPLLTEENLAEHNRLQEMITTKNDNLLKWTQELALCGRLSPPYSADDIPPELPIIKSNSKEIKPSIQSVNISSHTDEHLSSTTNVPGPTFLFPSSTYSLDLRSFYSLLPCWQYPNWPFQSIPSSSIKRHCTSIDPEIKRKKIFKLDSITSEKKEALTFHLHTHHHHHHIHNSKLSSENNKKTLLPLNDNNVLKNKDQSMLPTIENEVLNLSIKKSTRRKSSPIKRHINTDKPIRRILKRRAVSAAVTTNSPTIVSITGRGKRTNSASIINRKRSYSPASISLPLINNQSRKKQKILHYWILFGKSEQKLVSIDVDKPPVFRECYSSIRHITEKDVIKSNDCVILRSETGASHGATPYLAKVKWFWKEPTTGEIQMSLIWYYHPEHTELPLRIRERFLPNELLASKYWDCLSVACIEDKCYVLNFNEYNRYCLREKSVNLFEHSELVGQIKFLLNKNIPTIQHRSLPAKTVGNQNIFFCRYVYDYRVKRILKNPTFVTTASSM